MGWIDTLEDFDVVVSRDGRGARYKMICIDGKLHDVEDGFKWSRPRTIAKHHTIEGIYRTDRELKCYGLSGNIDSMTKIYPKVENYVARLKFTGDTCYYLSRISKKLWDSIQANHENIKYVLVVDKQGNKEIAEMINVFEIEAKDFEREVISPVDIHFIHTRLNNDRMA